MAQEAKRIIEKEMEFHANLARRALLAGRPGDHIKASAARDAIRRLARRFAFDCNCKIEPGYRGLKCACTPIKPPGFGVLNVFRRVRR